MNLISADSITKRTGDKTLFENVSLGVNTGEKAGITGINGAGKSTLLRILAGKDEPDEGSVIHNKELNISFLEQTPSYDPETKADAVLKEIAEKSPNSPEKDRLLRSFLQELSFSDYEKKCSELSGGTLKKIALAELFARESNLYILDEPTNHLDIETILWLEKKLIKTPSAVLLVTHDRYFLESIAEKIYEVQDGTVYRYEGNYSLYLEQKEERREKSLREEQKAKSFLKSELEWLKRQPKARGTKQKARIDRINEVAGRKKMMSAGVVDFSVSGRKLGKKILELKNISKSFSGKSVIDGFSYTFKGNERIGIIGPNGSGKSTLLKMILGQLETESGDIIRGVNTHTACFDQNSSEMDGDLKPVDFIKHSAGEKIIMPDGSTMTASLFLQRFLFTGRMQNTPIKRLSGGEKRRLYLVSVLMKNPNFLLLDEPSNDLDIATLSVLEEFIENFSGCVLTVSHDRYFMDRAVDYLFVFEGNGKISQFPGNFSDYLLWKENNAGEDENREKSEKKDKPKSPKNKLSFKEKQEFRDLEKEITSLEEEKSRLEKILQSGEGSPDEIARDGIRFQELEIIIAEKVLRWEELAVYEL